MGRVNKRSLACKVSRRVELLRPAGPGGLARVRLVTTKDAADYLARRVRSDIGGAGVEFVRLGEVEEGTGRYHALLAGADSSCECRGYLRHGTECKHLFAAWVLLSRGWL
jgi:hypothetical protein